MSRGTRLALIVLGGAAGIAALRALCVPVGSFRAGLEQVAWGITADSVRAVLGDPDRICTDPTVAHVELPTAPDSAEVRAALAGATAERWEYSDRSRGGDPPRVAGTACAAPIMATELGFDRDRRLRWIVREVDQTPVAFDPAIIPR